MAYISTGEAARMLGVGLNTVKRWISNGALRGVCTPGGHWRIAKEDLREFMRSSGMHPKARKMPGRVLVIDDEPSVCALHKAILEHADFPTEVQCVDDGYTGLIRIGTWRPDVLILDIIMPGINGLEVLRRIRADRDLDDMAIIVVTATFDQAEVAKTLQASGVVAILPKPLEPQRLLDIVGTWLALKEEGAHG